MRAHIIMNDPLAPPGAVGEWLQYHRYESEITRAYADEGFPSVDEFELLVILGGSVGAYEDQYEWLKREKLFIREAIKADKYVIGICLGAQMIAEVLGGRVYKMEREEIGWTPIFLSTDSKEKQSNLLNKVPSEFTVFQYHGDTFELPDTAGLIGQGNVCHNQLFKYKDKVLGLQFHPEFNEGILDNIIKHLGQDLQKKLDYKDNEALRQSLIKKELITDANQLLYQLLDNLTHK